MISGTYGGPLPGPGGKPIAATNKRIGYMFGLVTDFDGKGNIAALGELFTG